MGPEAGEPLGIDPDIRRARTPPPAFYRDAALHARVVERVFARAWHLVPCWQPAAPPAGHAALHPFTLAPGCLDEPLLLVDDGGERRVLSNVCTHRGNIVQPEQGSGRGLRCGYHGRRFSLEGRCVGGPGFEDVADFPGDGDHLRRLPVASLGPLSFASLEAASTADAADLLDPVEARIGFLAGRAMAHDPASVREYVIDAHWALYVENYLEGLHIPYVHPGLAQALDPRDYRQELLPRGTLQIGMARRAEEAFALPGGHPDAGQAVAAFYFWLWPATMLNFYPWGLSVNVVTPLSHDRTRIAYDAYVLDASRRGQGAGAGLDQVELEDQGVVTKAARGMRSRLYRSGRYAPVAEVGVHHFHRMLAAALEQAAASMETPIEPAARRGSPPPSTWQR